MFEKGLKEAPGPSSQDGVRTVAIAGPANAGKSTIYNWLSKSYSTVANYSQTTIDSIHKESVIDGNKFDFWDTPGLAGLTDGSDDENRARKTLIFERPDMILFVGDATRMKRTLTLLAQTLELGIPTVMVLNKIDAIAGKGIQIDVETLAGEIGIPVLATTATEKRGFEKIVKAIFREITPVSHLQYPKVVEDAVEDIRSCFTKNKPSRAVALLLLMRDKEALKLLHKIDSESALDAMEVSESFFRKSPMVNVGQALFSAQERWADRLVEQVTVVSVLTAYSFAQNAAWASRHPVFGWPIMLAIMWVTFHGVGTVATVIGGYFDAWIGIPLTGFIGGLVSNPALFEFLAGDFGILTMGVMNAIATVVPILIIFFLIVNFLEDVGYLPNLSVLLNRVFSIFGLTGKAVLSMSLGFGCNTMATLTSRMLETKKERIIASGLVALGVPCAVQLGVMIAILSTAPFSALLLVVGSVLATQIVCGMALNRMLKGDKSSDFIIELPPFTWPNWRNIVRKTNFRVRHFLKEALPLFVLGAALMFALDKTGLLTLIKKGAHPVVTGFLSLPDKVTEVFILVLSRRELGAVYFKNMVDAFEVDYYQTVVGLTVITLFIPCVSNTMVMIKELGLRWATAINVAIIVIAVMVGGLLNWLIRIF